MDKDNKYYGIIEGLVKNHRKFAGLEVILEDIIDDVYEHSEAIIESINDENVIEEYLSKVVSTSIITVPKKQSHSQETIILQLFSESIVVCGVSKYCRIRPPTVWKSAGHRLVLCLAMAKELK